jgi:hypothetical protein
LFIPDEKLRSIVLERTETEDKETRVDVRLATFHKKCSRVVAHYLDKGSSVTEALAELELIYKRIRMGYPGTHLLLDTDIVRIAQRKKLSTEQTRFFVIDLNHMIDSTRAILLQPIDSAKKRLKVGT